MVTKASLDEAKMEEALSHVKSGKSFRQAYLLTGVNYKKIEREAAKRGIKKGDLSQIIAEKTMVETKFVSLCDSDKTIVNDIVDERIKHIQFFNHAAIKNVQESMALRCESQQEFKFRSETIAKGREVVLGKAPDTALQINQNIDTGPKKVQFEVLDGSQTTTH